jgi:hypothetical protein
MTALAMAQGVGAKYGSREPAKCASMKDPVKGAPSAEQARRYALCYGEGEKGDHPVVLYLLQDLKIDVGKGTPFKQLPFQNRPGTADPDGLVYATRGTFKLYRCEPQITAGRYINVGKNCRTYDSPKVDGTCFRDNFGEWQCPLYPNLANKATEQPPPK